MLPKCRVCLLLLFAVVACTVPILLLRYMYGASYNCCQGQDHLPISFNGSYNDTERRYQELRVQLERTARRVAAAAKEDMQEISRLLVSDLRELWLLDGREQARQQLAQRTAALVQRRLRALQNPRDCRSAKRLVCTHIECGFGCQMHHMAYCLIVAYATQRTMVFSRNKKIYGTRWDEIFQPLSNTCGDHSGDKAVRFGDSEEPLVVQLPAVDPGAILLPTAFHPPAVPADLLPDIRLFHGAPHVWWVGQVMHYLLRPRLRTAMLIHGAIKRHNVSTPIVGIHVRRGDKLIREAKFHSVDEYMAAVEDIYRTLEISSGVVARRVLVVSDDISVFAEVNKKYPNYTVIGDHARSRMADKHNKEGLDGILVDVHLLSMCDYVVCTFSSNICRLVYEIMQCLYTDASMRVMSLDLDYGYVSKKCLRFYRVILRHSARRPDEMNMNRGDIIALKFYDERKNYGYNMNTSESGYFPIFKTVEDTKSVPFPTYPYI